MLSKKEILEKIKVLENIDITYKCIKTDTEMGVSVNHFDEEINIRFFGSYSLIDWVYNLFFMVTRFTELYVHSGFFAKFLSIKKQLDSLLSAYPTYTVNFFGFSQGGSIAFIAYYYLKTLNHKKVYAYLFAPARTALFSFKIDKSLFYNVYNFINKKDIVPSLPFWFWGYKHYGNKFYLNKACFLSKFFINPLKEHSIKKYKSLLTE